MLIPLPAGLYNALEAEILASMWGRFAAEHPDLNEAFVQISETLPKPDTSVGWSVRYGNDGLDLVHYYDFASCPVTHLTIRKQGDAIALYAGIIPSDANLALTVNGPDELVRAVGAYVAEIDCDPGAVSLAVHNGEWVGDRDHHSSRAVRVIDGTPYPADGPDAAPVLVRVSPSVVEAMKAAAQAATLSI